MVLSVTGAELGRFGAGLVRVFCGRIENAIRQCTGRRQLPLSGAVVGRRVRQGVGHNVARFCMDAQFGR